MNARKPLRRLLALGLLAGLTGNAAADGAPFDFCLTCHGADANGNPAIHAPRLAGLEPWYLKAQLQAFQAGWRGVQPGDAPGNEMRTIGVHMDAQQIAAAIAFVQGLKPRTPLHTVSGDAAQGRQLYELCAACHGPAGEGNAQLKAPALAQRTDWYLVTQLRNYRDGLRGTHPSDVNGQQMRAVVTASLTDDAAINDVVAYIDSLH